MSKLANAIRSRAFAMSTLSLASLSAFVVAHADGDEDFDSQAGRLVGRIINVLIKIVRWAGVVILAWGIISFVMGMRDEDVEKKHKATTLSLVGIAMVLIGFLLEPILSALGMNITISTTGNSETSE